ncbi:DUF4230 domain-containing protein [Sphingobium sp. SA916]|uniref:DUF4230 domain-containing protein n=1 Tax=Sphingobium sp. SA916 TaxID=1851207 RepID=UPI000C9F7869|nr:DUF4230 domain-containing protein [Sphingobium sp. SA916]PNP93714.1 hypothetical protein A8G00_07800 [Sphingobium sp. SA916]
MAVALKRFAGPVLAVLALLAAGAAMLVGWHRYERDYAVTVEEDGSAVTRVIAERFAGASSLKVSELSGTIQSTAQDVRGFGLLKSDQLVKMPFSVAYFIDVGGIGAGDLEWNEKNRTLIVNAPDVKPGRPNIDESRRTLVQTNGLFVTRQAGEELSRRTSLHAQGRADREARSPERMAQARDYGRAALGRLLGAPLGALGYGDARVIVTFPPERADRDRDRWDVTTPINDVLANSRNAR